MFTVICGVTVFLITSSPKPNICSTGEDQNIQQEKHLKIIVTLAEACQNVAQDREEARLRTRIPFDNDEVKIGSH